MSCEGTTTSTKLKGVVVGWAVEVFLLTELGGRLADIPTVVIGSKWQLMGRVCRQVQ